MRIYSVLILSIFIAFSCKKQEKAILHSEPTENSIKESDFEQYPVFAMTGDEDTVYARTYDLKGGYQLKMYPVIYNIDDYKKNEATGHEARLIGPGIDTIVGSAPAYQSKMLLRYDSIDFDDCFVIEYSGGGSTSLYVDVIEKKTGRKIIDEQGAATYDLVNQLIVYQDYDETGEMRTYDTKNKNTYTIEEPYDPCYGGMGVRFGWDIVKVTASYFYLTHPCNEDAGVKYVKVKR